MNKLEKINLILSEWDPINVGPSSASTEYLMYVENICTLLGDENKLTNYLTDLLNDLSVGFDMQNVEHMNSLKNVISKLIDIK